MTAAIANSEAAQVLAELAHIHTACEVARRSGTSDTMVRHLARGRRTPGLALQERIRDAWSVPLEAWSKPASSDALPASGGRRSFRATLEAVLPPKASPRAGQAGTALDDLTDTIARLDVALAAVEADKLISTAHVASLFRVKVDALDRLAKLRGEGELSIATIAKSAAWRDFTARLQEILGKHPSAAKDVAELFERLEAQT